MNNRWQPIHFWALTRLLHDVRGPLRWQWAIVTEKTRKHLQVVSPRGVRWDFKLSGGAFIRRANSKEPNADRSGHPNQHEIPLPGRRA